MFFLYDIQYRPQEVSLREEKDRIDCLIRQAFCFQLHKRQGSLDCRSLALFQDCFNVMYMIHTCLTHDTCESYSFQVIDRGEAERRLSDYAKSTRRRGKRVLFLLGCSYDRGQAFSYCRKWQIERRGTKTGSSEKFFYTEFFQILFLIGTRGKGSPSSLEAFTEGSLSPHTRMELFRSIFKGKQAFDLETMLILKLIDTRSVSFYQCRAWPALL